MSPILYANIALSMHKYSWKKYNNMFLSVIFLRYFPRRSNQTNQLFLEDILLKSKEASCSFEGDVTTDH